MSAGEVVLVGAGPGDPTLITVAGRAEIRRADVILYDRLAAPELLAEAGSGARLIDVGKAPGLGPSQARIDALLVSLARQGRRVVRLKGGDPFVFGRGEEEAEACRRAGIGCRIVPGLSSALAVPTAAGVPLTRRGVARSFCVITATTTDGKGLDGHDWSALAAIDTLVVLMGLGAIAEVAGSPLRHGLAPDTPSVAISAGTTDRQRQFDIFLDLSGQRVLWRW